MPNETHIRENLCVLGILLFFLLSFVSLSAAKFDTADKIWLILLVGLCSLFPLFLLKTHGIQTHPRKTLLISVFCVLLVVSYFFSQTKNFGLGEVIVISAFALTSILCTALHAASWHRIHTFFIALSAVAALYGFWYFPTHGEPRMAGLFFDAQDPRHFFPNAFANFLIMMWPIVILQSKRVPKKTWKFALLLGILFAALYLTYSRGAWATFLVQSLFIGFFYFRLAHLREWKNIGKFILVALSIAAFFVAGLTALRNKNFGSHTISEKLTFQNNEASTSFKERLQFWQGSLSLIQEKPLIGSGPMSFRYVYPQYQEDFLAISDHPHNWILRIAVENGLPAVIAFLAILAAAALIWKRKWKTSPTVLFLSVSLFGGVLHNMADYNMNFIPNLLIFFLLLGELFAYSTEKKSKILKPIAMTVAALILITISTISARELSIARTKKMNPVDPFAYQDSWLSRNFFLGEAERHKTLGDIKASEKLLDIHLGKNPIDARAWYMKKNAEKAVSLDPSNFFSYYRLYMESGKPISPQIYENLNRHLSAYPRLLAENIHYTAFSSNPEEAAKILNIMGENTRAQAILDLAKSVRENYPKEHSFNKELFPRTIRGALKKSLRSNTFMER